MICTWKKRLRKIKVPKVYNSKLNKMIGPTYPIKSFIFLAKQHILKATTAVN